MAVTAPMKVKSAEYSDKSFTVYEPVVPFAQPADVQPLIHVVEFKSVYISKTKTRVDADDWVECSSPKNLAGCVLQVGGHLRFVSNPDGRTHAHTRSQSH
jgi:hypothetical protein